MITVSTSTILLFLLAVLLGAVLTLAGAALGALVVFRTKKEPHESLFQVKKEIGDAFVLDDFGEEEEERGSGAGGREKPKDDVVPGIIAKQTERFLRQIKEKKKAEG